MSNTNIDLTEKEASGIFLFLKHLKYLSEMTDESAGKVIKALVNLKIDNTESIENLNFSERIVFEILKDGMESSLEKYRQVCEKRRIAGKKGAEKRWHKTDDSEDSSKNSNDSSQESDDSPSNVSENSSQDSEDYSDIINIVNNARNKYYPDN